mgnify:CR=1 FL=1
MLRYIEAIKSFNAIHNIVNTNDDEELAVRHILDSLTAAPHIAKLAAIFPTPQLADIGSGGGLPGIPLAATFPQYTFTLVERMTTRAGFLQQCAQALDLQNVVVRTAQAEEIPAGIFDIATFRAFRPLDKKIIRVLLRIVRQGGCLAAYKARREKIAEEMAAIRRQVPRYDVIPLTVPFLEDHERNLVVIRK